MTQDLVLVFDRFQVEAKTQNQHRCLTGFFSLDLCDTELNQTNWTAGGLEPSYKQGLDYDGFSCIGSKLDKRVCDLDWLCSFILLLDP